MSKKTTDIDTAAIAHRLTPKGREFMRSVGAGEFSFFDQGIEEHSGSWGSVLSEEGFANVRSASGVMGGTAKAGLWNVTTEQDPSAPDAGAWWSLTAEGAAVAQYLASQATAPARCAKHPAYDADYCPACGTTVPIGERTPEEALDADLPAAEPAAAESSADAAERADDWRDAAARVEASKTLDWTGNYNTVYVPVVEQIVAAAEGVEVAVGNRSTMLRRTHLYGGAADVSALAAVLADLESASAAALRAWQKTQDRKGQSDMEKYNQNRSFLAGYGAAVAQRLSGSKRMPVVAFARDMDRALRPDALKAGAAAARKEA